MASELEFEIQQHLSRYLDGSEERYEFENWLIPTLWDLAESDDEVSRELVGHIHNLIAETSNGDRSEKSLREELTRIATPFGPRIVSMSYEILDVPRDITFDFEPTRKGQGQVLWGAAPDVERQVSCA